VVKRVRESRRKPAEDAADAAPGQDVGEAPDELQALRHRVTELEAENASLREQQQALSAQLVD
jgi:cell division protein FtsB